jgi:ubiquitin-protein ligase
MADHKVLVEVLATVDHIRLVSTEGDPPHRYILDYHIKGLEPGTGNQPRERTSHRMQVDLPADYPRLAPHCRMLTPVFHPNIDDSSVCVGDHWTAGERLIDLVVRVGEMLAYQAYNIKSPLNGVAAMWADLNRQNLPTDARDLRPDRL